MTRKVNEGNKERKTVKNRKRERMGVAKSRSRCHKQILVQHNKLRFVWEPWSSGYERRLMF